MHEQRDAAGGCPLPANMEYDIKTHSFLYIIIIFGMFSKNFLKIPNVLPVKTLFSSIFFL